MWVIAEVLLLLSQTHLAEVGAAVVLEVDLGVAGQAELVTVTDDAEFGDGAVVHPVCATLRRFPVPAEVAGDPTEALAIHSQRQDRHQHSCHRERHQRQWQRHHHHHVRLTRRQVSDERQKQK